MFANGGTDYSKIKVGVKALEDAKINLGAYTKSTVPRNYTNKGLVIQAMANRDYETLREISNHFYRISGIYRRICDYVATMYRYDWYVFLETIGMDEKDLDESKAIIIEICKDISENNYYKVLYRIKNIENNPNILSDNIKKEVK